MHVQNLRKLNLILKYFKSYSKASVAKIVKLQNTHKNKLIRFLIALPFHGFSSHCQTVKHRFDEFKFFSIAIYMQKNASMSFF